MFPLSDDNPTRRPPIATIALILINALVWVFVQGLGAAEVLVERQGADPFDRRIEEVVQQRLEREYGLALLLSALTGVAAFEWISPISMLHRELIFGIGLGLTAVLGVFLFDLFIPDFVPFVDELLLAIATIIVGNLTRRRGDDETNEPSS